MEYTFLQKKTVGWIALTSLEDCAAASWRSAMFYLLSTSGLSKVDRKMSTESTPLGSLSNTIWAGVGRSPLVADQPVKVQFEKLNVECVNLQVQCPKSDVGSENLKAKC